MKGLYVYISGPFSLGDKQKNIAKAIDVAEELFRKGHIPFCPHLFHYWNLKYAHTYDEWLSLGLEWLKNCDAIIRIPGQSLGSDKEVEAANELGIPIFSSASHFLEVAEDISEEELLNELVEQDTDQD